jgi:surface antigen
MNSRRILLVTVVFALQGCAGLGTGVKPSAPGSAAGPTPAELLAPLKGGLFAEDQTITLNERERTRAVAAEYTALEAGFGQPAIAWTDEAGGSSGSVVAGAPYRVGSQDCRPYTHTISKAGAQRAASGSACRQPNGAWLRLA